MITENLAPPGSRVVIYTRVSRDDTGDGKSNERQEEQCRLLARMREWEIVAVESDVSISAYSGKARPAWERVLSMVERGEVDVIAAWAQDRITRTVYELTRIIRLCSKHGAIIATASGDLDLSTPQGKAVAQILGSIAEMEVEQKGARQKLANAQRRAEGQPWRAGWRAFGYELDGTLIPTEADLIREAASDVLAGTPLREIVRRWRDAGASTPRSSKGAAGWTHNGVRSILLNPRNAGLVTYKGEIVGRGKWKAIVSEETHTLLVAKLSDPSRRTNAGPGRQPANLLSGIARCGTCDEPVTGGTIGRSVQVAGKRTMTGERVRVYKCPNDHLSTDRADADAVVRRAFASAVALTRPGLLVPIQKGDEDAGSLLSEAQRLRDSLADLAHSFAAGRITIEQLESASTGLRDRLDAVEAALSEGGSDGWDPNALRAENVRKFLDLDLSGQRAILSALAAITLFPKGKGRKNVPITDQVTVFLRATRPTSSGRFIPNAAKDGSHTTPSEYLIPALNDRSA